MNKKVATYAAFWCNFKAQHQNKKNGIKKVSYISGKNYALKISYILGMNPDLTYYHNSLLLLKKFLYFAEK